MTSKSPIHCNCGHFRTSGNEYFVCPKCRSVCRNSTLTTHVGYFCETYDREKILVNFDELYRQFELTAPRMTDRHDRPIDDFKLEQRMYRYRVEIYETQEDWLKRVGLDGTDPISHTPHLQPTAVIVRNSQTGQLQACYHRDKRMPKYVKLPGSFSVGPNIILAMSNKEAKFVTDLNPVAMHTVHMTNRLFRGITVPSSYTIQDIINRIKETAFRFLPDKTLLDLDRPPAEACIKSITRQDGFTYHRVMGQYQEIGDRNIYADPNWYDSGTSGTNNAWLTEVTRRWINYYSPDTTGGINNHFTYAPLDLIPENGSMLAIPIRREQDRYFRKYHDDFRLFIQITHRDMKS